LGVNHTCALLENATLKCWGLNGSGQLGLGDTQSRGLTAASMGDALPAVNLGASRVPQAISAGEASTCALLRSGELICWGANNLGQLGQENTTAIGSANVPASAPVIGLGAGLRAVALTTSESFSCVRLGGQSIKCFGLNAEGQLGLGDTVNRGDRRPSMGSALPAVAVEPGLTARDVQCGRASCCAIINLSGALKCWGANESGQLGLEDTAARGAAANQMGISLPFVELGRLSRVLQVAVGAGHVCALLESGSLKCWGKNDNGQLGLGHRNNVGDIPGSMGEALRDVAL
jgi:alpha-tubulin suppressor-like RCC1 family protein